MSLIDGLISYWKMDEASEVNAANDSFGNNHLNLINVCPSVAGKIGNARDFESSAPGYFTIPSNASLQIGDSEFTFTAWVKLESLTSGTILSKDNTVASIEYSLAYTTSSSRFYGMVTSNGGSPHTVYTPGGIAAGGWYFLVFWHDPVADKIYIQVNDGTASELSHPSGVFVGTSSFIIGAQDNSSPRSPFDGLIDEVGFWKRILTPEERTALYNNGDGLAYSFGILPINVYDGITVRDAPNEAPAPGPLLTNLISYWKLDEASGDALDAHGTNPLTDNNAVGAAAGKVGGARDFIGTVSPYDFFRRASNASLSTGDIDFTIAFWVNYRTNSPGQIYVLKWDTGLWVGEYIVYRNPSAGFRFEVQNGAAGVTSPVPTINSWYHVVCWHDSVNNQIGISVNGGTPTTAAYSAGITEQNVPFQIGDDASNPINGLVDEVGFWKRMLTSNERLALYGSGAGLAYPLNPPVVVLSATGGTITTVGGSTIHTFTSSGTFTVTAGTGEVSVLIVGGGGAGGKIGPDSNGGGGGGAGQVRVVGTRAVAVGSYTVVVGAGGVSTLFVADATHDGGVSSFDGLTAIGGGGGAGVASYPGGNIGRTGASGGGGCGSFAGGTGTAGFNGGSGIQSGGSYGGGGGGGAGAVGINGTGSAGGGGGTGVSNYFSGTPTFYGGGGGGGTYSNPPAGTGGAGGGGAGKAGTGNGVAGTANTGGGGGGAGSVTATGGTGGAGGSGIVIIAYPPPPPPPPFDTITVSEFVSAFTIPRPPLVVSAYDDVPVRDAGWTERGYKVNPADLLVGLVSYWKMQQATTPVLDSVGTNDLTAFGTVPPSISTPGVIGNAWDVQQSGVLMKNPAGASLTPGNTSFTFCFWIKFNSIGTTSTIFGKIAYPVVDGQYEFDAAWDALSGLNFAWRVFRDGIFANRTLVLGSIFGYPTLGEWYFLVLWHDAEKDRIGIATRVPGGGGNVNTKDHAGGIIALPNLKFLLGSWTGASFNHTGVLDEVGYWSRVLTSSERDFLYNDGTGQTYPFNTLLISKADTVTVSQFLSMLSAGGGNNLLGGLVAYWKMDETSGYANDSYGVNHLTPNASPPTSAVGRIGNARDFEGSTAQRFTSPQSGVLSTGDIDFTISAWVKFESLPVGVVRGIVSKWFGTTKEFVLHCDPTPRFAFTVYGVSGVNVISTVSGLAINTWYHVIAWHDSVNNQLGIVVNDGTPDLLSHADGVTARPIEPFVIGAYEDVASTYWDGLIDEVGFWKRVLTAEERTALYNSGSGLAYSFFSYVSPPIPSGDDLFASLVSYWMLDEVSGNALDAHGTNPLTDVNTVGTFAGKVASARSFTGADHEYFTRNPSGADLSTGDIDFTFSCWVKITTQLYANDSKPVFSKFDAYAGNTYSEFRLYASSLWFTWVAGTAFVTATNFGALQVGDWLHVVCWHDSVNNMIGISVNNGTPNLKATLGAGISAPDIPFKIGFSITPAVDVPSDPDAYWDGLIDEVGFWKRLLSLEERAALYNSGNGLAYSAFVPLPTNNLLTDLIAYWKLDEASGDALDSHSFVNDLSASASAPTSAVGKIGNARDFEQSTSQRFSRIAGEDLSTGDIDFSISCWVKIESFGSRGIVSKWYGPTKEFVLATFLSPTRFQFQVFSFTAVSVSSTTTTLALDTWYHVVAWHDSVNDQLGIVINDGVPDLAANAYGVTARPDEPFVIGAYQSTASVHWDGLIDEVGFWKRVLTPEERTLLYNGGSGLAYSSFGAGTAPLPSVLNISVDDPVIVFSRGLITPPTFLTDLVSYWKLDEASGNALDSHGTKHLTDIGAVGSAAGKISGARAFVSTDAECFESLDSGLITGDIDFTFSCWVKPTNTSIILNKWDGDGEFFLAIASRFFFHVSGGILVQADQPPNEWTNVWYHVVCWHDSINNELGISVNDIGPYVISHTTGTQVRPSVPFSIGYRNQTDSLIDEVGFWKRVLTPAERTALYNGGEGLAYPFGLSGIISISVGDTVTVSDPFDIFVLTGGSLVPDRISRSNTVTVSDLVSVNRTLVPTVLAVSDTVTAFEETKVFALKLNTYGISVYDRVSASGLGTITPNYTLPLFVALSGGAGNADPTQSLGGVRSSSLVLSQQFSQTDISGLTIIYAGGNSNGQGRLYYFTAASQAGIGEPRRPALWWKDPGAAFTYRATPITGDGVYSVEGYDYGMVLVKVVVALLDTVNSWNQPIDINFVANQLFDPLTTKQTVEGHTDYRCIYLVNSLAEGGQDIHDIWISSMNGSFSKVLVGGIEFARGDGITTQVAPVIPDDTTAPPGVTFYDVPTGSFYVPVGTLGPGEAVAVWLKREVPPNSGFTDRDTLQMAMEVTYNGDRLSFYFTSYYYTLKDHLAQPWTFDYPFQIVAPFELDAPLFTQKVRTDLEIVYGFGNRAAAAFDIDANLLQRVARGWDFSYLFTSTARREFVLVGAMHVRAVRAFEFVSETRSTQKTRRSWELVCGLFTTAAITVITSPIITIKGYSFPVEQAEVRLDEGQYAWACTVTLYDPVYYDLFQPGDEFSIDMLGEEYVFLYDGKSFSRNSIVDIQANVSGISPSAVLGEPRSTKITKTWDTSVMALQAVQEVIEGYPLVWEILNWSLPAFRLAVEDMTPIEIVQLIAKAAGGVVQTDPDGTLRVRYLFPVRVPDYPSAVEDQFYSDIDHNFTINEEVALPEIVNKIRIMDIAPGAFQDRVEFVQDEEFSDRGYLKVFPSPWRETLFVEHTSKPSVSATYVGVVTEKLEPEDVEILESRGSVSHPIYQLNTLEWLYRDLGGIVFESDKSEFTTTSTTEHESLLRITYTTRYLRFNVVAPGIEKVQFLVKEEEVI